MLQNIHDKAKGWVAYLIVFLISIPFALFGINSYLGGGADRVVADVNGEEIQSSTIDKELLQLKQQFAQVPGFDDNSLKQLALDRVISRTLLQQEVKNQGYRASSSDVIKEISKIPAFQKEGKFDAKQYKQILKANRRNENMFEQQVRSEIAQNQFQGLVSTTAFIPTEEATHYQSLKDQKRDIETFTLKMADYADQAQVSDTQIKEYYEKNKARYMTPERVKIAYVELKRSDFEAALTPSDDELTEYYNNNVDRYVISEKRHASHILITIPSAEKEAEARKKAEAILAEIKAGTRSFEDAAKTESADTVSADNGGDLGVIIARDWGKEFNNAVFSLGVNEVSDVVKTEAGYEIIKLTQLEPSVQKTFDEAKADVDKDFRSEQAAEMFQNKDDELPTLAYENETDLAPVAEALRLKVQTTDWFSRSQGKGIAAIPQIRDAAFSEEIKATGHNSEKLDIADGHSVVIRVIDQQAASQKPLDVVKAEISTALKTQETRKIAIEKGKALLTKLKTQQNWSALTELSLGTEEQVEKHGSITRKSNKVDPQIINTAFAMKKPTEGKLEYSNVVMPNGDYSIILVKSVQAGDTKIDDSKLQGFSSYLSSREQGAMMQALREEADIKLYPENL